MTRPVTASIVVPVATVEDARATGAALEPYDIGDVTVMHVVEKGGGVPDKTPVEQSEEIAADAFAAFRARFPDADTATVYRRDVVAGIVELAADLDATAIVFRPRGGSRLVQLLAGDRARRLMSDADRPVIALPEGDDQ